MFRRKLKAYATFRMTGLSTPCHQREKVMLWSFNNKKNFDLISIYFALKFVIFWPANVIIKFAKGHYSLSLSFWWFCFFGYIPFTFLILYYAFPFYMAGFPVSPIFHTVGFLYPGLSVIGVYNSAKHDKTDPKYGKRATIIAIFVALSIYVRWIKYFIQ